MRLAIALLLIVAGTHYLPDPLAVGYPHQVNAARAWFYVLRGIEGVALFSLVCTGWALICSATKRWTSLPLVTAACLWGVAEEAQTAICRLGIGIDKAQPSAAFEGLCGVLTGGFPFYAFGLAVAAGLATWVAYSTDRAGARCET